MVKVERIRTDKGRDIWHIHRDGKVETIITRKASVKAIKEASIIYRRALKRLALK